MAHSQHGRLETGGVGICNSQPSSARKQLQTRFSEEPEIHRYDPEKALRKVSSFQIWQMFNKAFRAHRKSSNTGNAEKSGNKAMLAKGRTGIENASDEENREYSLRDGLRNPPETSERESRELEESTSLVERGPITGTDTDIAENEVGEQHESTSLGCLPASHSQQCSDSNLPPPKSDKKDNNRIISKPDHNRRTSLLRDGNPDTKVFRTKKGNLRGESVTKDFEMSSRGGHRAGYRGHGGQHGFHSRPHYTVISNEQGVRRQHRGFQPRPTEESSQGDNSSTSMLMLDQIPHNDEQSQDAVTSSRPHVNKETKAPTSEIQTSTTNGHDKSLEDVSEAASVLSDRTVKPSLLPTVEPNPAHPLAGSTSSQQVKPSHRKENIDPSSLNQSKMAPELPRTEDEVSKPSSALKFQVKQSPEEATPVSTPPSDVKSIGEYENFPHIPRELDMREYKRPERYVHAAEMRKARNSSNPRASQGSNRVPRANENSPAQQDSKKNSTGLQEELKKAQTQAMTKIGRNIRHNHSGGEGPTTSLEDLRKAREAPSTEPEIPAQYRAPPLPTKRPVVYSSSPLQISSVPSAISSTSAQASKSLTDIAIPPQPSAGPSRAATGKARDFEWPQNSTNQQPVVNHSTWYFKDKNRATSSIANLQIPTTINTGASSNEKGKSRWPTQEELKPIRDPRETGSNAWGSDVPGEGEGDAASVDSNTPMMHGRLITKKAQQYESKLAGWDGKFAPAPEEWDWRPPFNNNSPEYLAWFFSWLNETVNLGIIVDVNLDIFKNGHSHPDGRDLCLPPEDDDVDYSLDPEDDMNKQFRHETANELVKNWNAKNAKDKADLEAVRQSLRRDALERHYNSAPPEPNENSPKANIYLRPVVLSDDQQLTDLYNYYVTDSVRASELRPISTNEMRGRIRDAARERLPFIVAVERSTKKFSHGHYAAETVVGFALATDVQNANSTNRYTAELELYVHHKRGEERIGRCLMDKLLHVCDNTYLPRGGYPFTCNTLEQGAYSMGGNRYLGNLMLQVRFFATDDSEYQRIKRWLAREWNFEEQGLFKGTGAKFGKLLNTGWLIRRTGFSMPDGFIS